MGCPACQVSTLDLSGAAASISGYFKVPERCSATDGAFLDGSGNANDNCFTMSDTSGLGTTCPEGTIGVITSNELVKVCTLCPAGSACKDDSSEACPGGKTTFGVGESSCDTDCLAGTYAPAGESSV